MKKHSGSLKIKFNMYKPATAIRFMSASNKDAKKKIKKKTEAENIRKTNNIQQFLPIKKPVNLGYYFFLVHSSLAYRSWLREKMGT